MRPVGSASELEARRKEAVRRVRAGERPAAVAEQLGVSRVAIYGWIRKASQHGSRALNAVPQHVPQSRMSRSQQRQLRTVLLRGARARGYPTDLWTCERLAEVIRQDFGIRYNCGHLSRVLRALGYSCQSQPAVPGNGTRPPPHISARTLGSV